MCGLAGVAGNVEKSDLEVFQQLLYLSALRGMDSTGIATVRFDEPNEVNVIKTVGNPVEFLDRKTVRDAIKEGSSLLMGHTRSRTVGDVTKKNAQPFDFDNVVGTHNGTLCYTSKGKLEGREIAGTDSMALYMKMNQSGLDGVIANVLEADAMALVWYEKAERKLHLYRNDKRPLYYAISKKNQTIYWASESGMLYLVLNRNQIQFHKIVLLQADQHMIFTIPEKKNTSFTKPVARIQKIPPQRASVTSRRYFGTAGKWDTVLQKFVYDNEEIVDGNQKYKENIVTGEWELVEEDKKLPLVPAPTTKIGSPTTAASSETVDMRYNPATFSMEPIKPKPVKTTATIIRLPARAAAAPLLQQEAKWRLNRLLTRLAKDGGDFYRSDGGRVYDKDKFEEKMFEGCANCSCTPAWGEPVKFLRDEDFLCMTCVAEAKLANDKGEDITKSNVAMLLNQMV